MGACAWQHSSQARARRAGGPEGWRNTAIHRAKAVLPKDMLQNAWQRGAKGLKQVQRGANRRKGAQRGLGEQVYLLATTMWQPVSGTGLGMGQGRVGWCEYGASVHCSNIRMSWCC